jgi:opacity protein-like surface antigen
MPSAAARHYPGYEGEWMIGKFATASALMVLVVISLLGAHGIAQTTPAEQPSESPAAAEPAPAAQTPVAQAPAQPATGGQEPADEESTSRRKRVHDYKTWNYNVGVGANLDSGTTKQFVRGGGIAGTAGVARNANKYFGLRADFIFADLPLRDSALQLAQASGDTSYMLGVTLDPIINFSVTSKYGAYVLFGPGFYHRSGSLSSDTTVPGSPCNSFFIWWGTCFNSSLPLSGKFVDSSQNQFGYNFGGGVTRKMPSGVELYAEYRFTHGSHNGITTDVRPITIGVRW